MKQASHAGAGSPAPRSWLRGRWPRVLVSLLLLVALLSTVEVEPERVMESARRVIWWPIAAALLLRPLAVWANAWHAALLLDSVGAGLSLREVWRVSMFGEMLSRLVPGNLGTLAYIAKLARRPADAILAQVLDRVLFLVFTLSLAAPSLALAGHARLALATLAALAGALGLGWLVHAGVLRWAPLGASQRSILARIAADSARWRAPYALAALSSIGLMTLLFWLLVLACGGTVGVFEAVAAVTLVTIGAALPVSINGVGIREWVFLVILGDHLPSKAATLTLAAVTYALGFASALVGVVAWALMRQKNRPANAES